MTQEPPKSHADRLIREYHIACGRHNFFERRARILTALVEYCDAINKHITRLSCREMDSFIPYLLKKGLTHAQIAQEFSRVRKFYDYLCEQELIDANYTREVFARAHKFEPRFYEDEELQQIFKTHHPRS